MSAIARWAGDGDVDVGGGEGGEGGTSVACWVISPAIESM